jgi:catechol 2,3-dioxygenase-like lactoylglutathione lyase family enzyme
MQLNKLRQVAARAGDLDATVAFYRDVLGATLMGQFPNLAFFDFSGTRLMLENEAQTATLYFWVDDIDSAFKSLKDSGVTFVSDPHAIFRDDAGQFGPAGESEVMAFFNDPAGNTLALASRRQDPD